MSDNYTRLATRMLEEHAAEMNSVLTVPSSGERVPSFSNPEHLPTESQLIDHSDIDEQEEDIDEDDDFDDEEVEEDDEEDHSLDSEHHGRYYFASARQQIMMRQLDENIQNMTGNELAENIHEVLGTLVSQTSGGGVWREDLLQHILGMRRAPIDTTKVYCPVPSCALLTPGQSFSGEQQVTILLLKSEAWKVTATIQSYDPHKGIMTGIMKARDVPEAESPVTTFFEGEIIDNINFSFFSTEAMSSLATDLQFWSKFPSFKDIKSEVVTQGGRSVALATHPYVYMRWKERFFIGSNGGKTEGGGRLTIAGFYYVCLNRVDGTIEGWYFDKSGPLEQKLKLAVDLSRGDGHAFGAIELA